MNVDFDNSFVREKAFYTFENSEAQQFSTLAVLECRGCEIIAFDPKVSSFPSCNTDRPRADGWRMAGDMALQGNG